MYTTPVLYINKTPSKLPTITRNNVYMYTHCLLFIGAHLTSYSAREPIKKKKNSN